MAATDTMCHIDLARNTVEVREGILKKDQNAFRGTVDNSTGGT